tara:strand:- start:151 stop:690 length:540 start_codon:yes stop_codon:yes gene_type:complete
MKQEIKAFRSLVEAAHGDQKYGKQPYINHIDHVVQVAKRFGYCDDVNMIMGCLGHDLLEDTNMNLKTLRTLVPEEVAMGIFNVTDEVRKEGEGRLENKERTFHNRTSKSQFAIKIKMFDRIANIESCIAENIPKLLLMYLKEHTFFESILRAHEVEPNVWRYMGYLKETIIKHNMNVCK